MPQEININKLGVFLDGWADLAEGKGDKAEKVRQDILKQLESREMPEVETTSQKGYVDVTKGRREYIIVSTFPGATTAIYITQHGKDLYASWRSFMRPVINLNLMIILIVVAFVWGLVAGASNPSSGAAVLLLGGWAVGFIGLCILVGIAGYVMKQNVLAFFFIEPNHFDGDDVMAMNLSVHYSVLRALDKAGIDSAKLRLKSDFKTGRRGDIM